MKLQVETTKFMQLLKGFSLIELMIVVAIIGVLASIALPAYEGYIFRARMSHLMSMSSDIKAKLTEYRALNGTWPPDLKNAYTVPQDPYVLGVFGETAASNGYKVAIQGMKTGLVDGDPILKLEATYTAATAVGPASVSWSCSVYQGGPQTGGSTMSLTARPSLSIMSGSYPSSYFTSDCPVASAAY